MGESNDTRAPANADTVDANTALTEAAEREADNLPFELPPPGYQLGTMIGKGGMGEVMAAHDQRIGRDVAFKRMRNADASGDALARFLREARIQARLDHPAVVPVYELGKDAEGRPFFTMKRLTGKTLTAHLADKDAPRQPLLRAFAEVCLAVELAHSKGVIHRDLKPSNIMLGDFGEVYVLDWGIARVMGGRRRAPTNGMQADDIDSVPGEGTMTGDMLGTPGYMSPEQMRGQLDVGPKADVYSLGSILFEILTGEPLHPRGHASVASTLTMEEASPAQRKPERNIAPELDAACASTLVADPQKRPTARELAEKITRYLDGDRDVERRRAIAAENLATARTLLAEGDAGKRAEAMRAAGRALALDPESKDAAQLVSSMIVEAPAQNPPELVAEIEANEIRGAKTRALKGMIGLLTLSSLSVLVLFLEVRSWAWVIAIWVTLASLAGLMWTTYRTGRVYGVAILLYGVALAIEFSRIASPLILVPALMCGAMLPFSNIPRINDRPIVLYVWCLAVAMVPSLLELVGVLTPTLRIGEGNFVELYSEVFVHSPRAGIVSLVIANAVLLLTVARYAIAIGRDRRDVQGKLTNQAWHLRKLLP
ncbi:MAG TPA: serine/threonine-protein kinase [Kofleriaceae bacterium]|nr:serine/threonine-protein kinase [Kofleriaceae bacterium]